MYRLEAKGALRRTRKVGNARSQGTFKGSVQDYAYYFDGGSSPVTFAAGETTKIVNIPVLDTAGAEPTEIMALNLFNGVNATIGRPLATRLSDEPS